MKTKEIFCFNVSPSTLIVPPGTLLQTVPPEAHARLLCGKSLFKPSLRKDHRLHDDYGVSEQTSAGELMKRLVGVWRRGGSLKGTDLTIVACIELQWGLGYVKYVKEETVCRIVFGIDLGR